MANVLSQNEIDELLNALSAGEDISVGSEDASEQQSVRLYDFRTANKFYKEQMRTFNIIFDNFAYLLSNKLTGLLHTMCEVEVVSVEEQIFGEFSNSLPSPVLLGIIEMPPLQGSVLMEITPALAYGFISRLFGGAADYTETSKSFTEIEMSIIENILHQIMLIIQESFSKILEIEPVLSRIETSSQFAQIAAMNEPAAIITLDAKFDSIQDMISICIPHFSIQPISKELNTGSWTLASNVAQNQTSKKDTIKHQLDNTYVNMQATFNDTQTTLQEILSLKVGDVICINHNINEYITVNVEHMPKFKGVIGNNSHKYVVQVAKVIKENEGIE